MKKAITILSIIGGSLLLLTCIFNIQLAVLVDEYSLDLTYDSSLWDRLPPVWFALMVACFTGGVLGIVGGLVVNKKRILAGVFMAIAAAASIWIKYGGIFAVLLAIAAVLTFVNKPDNQMQSSRYQIKEIGLILGIVASALMPFLTLGKIAYMQAEHYLSAPPFGFIDSILESFTVSSGPSYWTFIIVGVISTGLGILACVMLRKHRNVSGIMFILAAVMGLFTMFAAISSVLFIAAAVIAFIKRTEPCCENTPSP